MKVYIVTETYSTVREGNNSRISFGNGKEEYYVYKQRSNAIQKVAELKEMYLKDLSKRMYTIVEDTGTSFKVTFPHISLEEYKLTRKVRVIESAIMDD